MLIQTRSTAPKMFAKFGLQTRTFCHQKMEKVIAKLKSDSLESIVVTLTQIMCYLGLHANRLK